MPPKESKQAFLLCLANPFIGIFSPYAIRLIYLFIYLLLFSLQMYWLQALATDPSYICGVDVCIVLIVLFLNIAKSLLDCSLSLVLQSCRDACSSVSC